MPIAVPSDIQYLPCLSIDSVLYCISSVNTVRVIADRNADLKEDWCDDTYAEHVRERAQRYHIVLLLPR